LKIMSRADLEQLVSSLRRDNHGREDWSARFECSHPHGVGPIVEALSRVAGVDARLDGDARTLRVTFPRALVVAIARVVRSGGAVYAHAEGGGALKAVER
jgi:hypothetical protein